MKIDRLLGILSVLQQKQKVTAPELAAKFEVSRRTINRDIEDICKAGIPLVTMQGAGGGVSIMEGYRLDTTLFTEEELLAILIGIKSLDSISQTPRAKYVAEKFGGGAVIPLADNIMIDLSSYYKESLAGKIEIIKQAMRQSRYVRFHYYYNKGEADKEIEPYLIFFKWSSWYVFGYCAARQDFRTYKLNRLWRLEAADKHFTPREIPEERLDFDRHMTDDYRIAVLFDASEKFKLIEEYGEDCYTETEDGRLLFRRGFTNLELMTGWLLGFGAAAEVLEPAELREKIRDTADEMLRKYRST